LWKKKKIHTAAISSVFSDLSRIHGQILVYSVYQHKFHT